MKLTRTNLKILIAIAMLVACRALLPSRFLITTTSPVTPRVFFVTKLGFSDSPQRGEYVNLKDCGDGSIAP